MYLPYRTLGKTYRDLKRNELAVDFGKKSVELDPDQAGSYVELGFTYQEMNED